MWLVGAGGGEQFPQTMGTVSRQPKKKAYNDVQTWGLGQSLGWPHPSPQALVLRKELLGLFFFSVRTSEVVLQKPDSPGSQWLSFSSGNTAFFEEGGRASCRGPRYACVDLASLGLQPGAAQRGHGQEPLEGRKWLLRVKR